MDAGSPVDEQYRRYIKSRSPKDLAPIFQELAPKLLAAAKRAGLDGQGAEDVVQETFLAVIESEDRFDPARSFVAWVRGIALRQMRAERRRRARLASLLRADHEAEATDLEGRDPAAESVSSTDFQRKVEEAIIALTEGNQKVVRAALFEGLSVDEMAERFDLSNGAVSVRLHRGLSRLRARLKESSSMAVLAFGAGKERGLEVVWQRLTREIPRATPAKAAATSTSLSGGLLIGALLLATSGAAAWFITQRSEGKTVDAPAAPSVAEAPATSGDTGEPGDAAGPAPNPELIAAASGVEESAASETIPNDGKDIRGTVVARGVSLAPEDAQVFLLESDPGIVLPDAPMVPVAATDKDGVYWLSADDLSADPTPILIVRHGTEIGWVDVPESAIKSKVLPELQLVPELVVAVKVTDEFGRPIEGARLSAWTQAKRFMARPLGGANLTGVPSTRPYEFLFGGVTDENGEGLVRGLYGADTPGLVTLCAAWKSGYASSTLALRSPGQRRIEMEMTLLETKNLSLRGRVVDEAGDPIASAKARFSFRGESDISTTKALSVGPDGEWSVPSELLDDYPLQIEFQASKFASRRYYVEQAQGLPSDPVIIELPTAKLLTGRVVDEADQPLAGATVIAAVAGEFQELTANADGDFESPPMLRAPALITVTATDDQGKERSAKFHFSTEENGRELVVPKPDGYAEELNVRLPSSLQDDSWSRAELYARDVPGFVGAILPDELDGDGAVFRQVPVGQWLFYGLTSSGVQAVHAIAVSLANGETAVEFALLEEPQTGGTIDYVLGPLPPDSPSNYLVFTRRTDLPRLPGWMQVRAGGLRRELVLGHEEGRPTTLAALSPGEWEISAAGEGWRTRTQFLTVTPGQSTRVDLQPEPSSTVTFVAPTTAAAGIISVEVREHGDQEWTQVGLSGVSADIAANLAVQLPVGQWSWRVRLQTLRPSGLFKDMTPPAYGTVTVAEGEAQEVRVGSGSVTPK